MNGDKLADYLTAKGYDQDTVDETVERAALLQFLAGKSRWKAGVDAQVQVIGKTVVNAHDI